MLPIALNCAGRKVLLVGGGPVACRKYKKLHDCGALITLVAPEADTFLQEQAASGQLTWHRRAFQDKDLDGTWLVYVAIDNQEVSRHIAQLCQQQQIWFWLGGQPEESAFWSMALTSYQGVTLAVSAQKRPRLAQELARQLSQWLKGQFPGH